jgi:septum formation topological specificity factor MinE
MDYLEFLKSDILCLLYDYGEMTAEEINSMLGSTEEEVETALLQLLLEEKVREVGAEKYATVDEVNVKRLKKSQPSIF